jgi:hypothetical protein
MRNSAYELVYTITRQTVPFKHG